MRSVDPHAQELAGGRGAVVLAANAKGEAHVRAMARSLVTEARRLGLDPRDVLRIVEGELS